VLAESALRDVRVTGNVVDDSVTGISIVGVSTYDTGPGLTNTGNEVRGVTVAGNTVSNNASAGIELIGAYAGVGQHRSGTTSQNRIADVTIEANTVGGNKHGIAVNGAIATGAADDVSGNRIEGLRVTRNQITDSVAAGVGFQVVNAPRGTTMRDNRIVDSRITDNVIRSASTAGIAVGANAVPGAQVGGNGLDGLVLARNTITDVAGGARRDRGFGILLNGQSAAGMLGPVHFEGNTIQRASCYGLALFRTNGHTLVRNNVTECGRGALFGSKRRNTLIDNVFGKRVRRKKAR